jgi:succinyl-diaminopimelate desuccinylase
MLQSLIATPLDDGTAHFQASSLQVTTIDIGNPTDNVIPGVARATFNIRYNDRWSSASLKAWMKERLDGVGGRYDLHFRDSSESFLVPPGEVSAVVSKAIEQVTGRKPELSTTGGTSDACFIHRYCPLAEFGLVGLTQHKVDEHVPLADLTTLTEVYGRVLDLYFPAR